MNKDIEQAIEKIVDNFDMLLKKQNQLYSQLRDQSELSALLPKDVVWFNTTDHSDPYEYYVDEEWLGITRNGKITWAYASGCSCWDGDYEAGVCDTMEIKSFKFRHDDMKAEWQDKLIEFARAM